MSVNYHAYQNREVPFAECEALYEQWTEEFAGFTPRRVGEILGLVWDEAYVYLSYFQTSYRLCLKNGKLEKQTEGQWDENLMFNEAMVIYHLLKYTKDYPGHAGVWVPNSALDKVISRNDRRPDPLLTPFAKSWTGRGEALAKACEAAGGKRIEKGDVGYQFAAFPFLEVQIVFWDQDEDFPAQVQVLFDERVTDYIHFETTGCIVADILGKIGS